MFSYDEQTFPCFANGNEIIFTFLTKNGIEKKIILSANALEWRKLKLTVIIQKYIFEVKNLFKLNISRNIMYSKCIWNYPQLILCFDVNQIKYQYIEMCSP